MEYTATLSSARKTHNVAVDIISPNRDREAQRLELLYRLESQVWRESWRRKSGRTDRSVVIALLRHAARDQNSKTPERLRVTVIPAGLRVPIAFRSLALKAGCSLSTLRRSVVRLKQRGLLRQDNVIRRDGEAGAFVLLDRGDVDSPATDHETDAAAETTTGARTLTTEHLGYRNPLLSSKLFTSVPSVRGGVVRKKDTPPAARIPLRGARASLRWGPGRLGKTAECILDVMRSRGVVSLSELEAITGARARDLRRRTMGQLVGAGIVEMHGEDTYELTPYAWGNLQIERGLAGELEAEQRQEEKDERARTAFKNRDKNKPDRAPSQAEMDQAKREREESKVDGNLGELERVPDDGSDDFSDISDYLAMGDHEIVKPQNAPEPRESIGPGPDPLEDAPDRLEGEISPLKAAEYHLLTELGDGTRQTWRCPRWQAGNFRGICERATEASIPESDLLRAARRLGVRWHREVDGTHSVRLPNRAG